MKVIFLDFDGVLNSRDWFTRREAVRQGIEPDKWKAWREEHDFDPVAVKRLNKLVTEMSAVVVVSSSWRLGRSTQELARILKDVGFVGSVLDRTPDRSSRAYERFHEIRAWLKQNPTKKY